MVLLVGCEPRKSNIEPEWNRENVEIQTTPFVFDNKRDMHKALSVRLDRDIDPNLEGMAIMSPDDTFCELFIVRPNRIDDQHTLTLGHEFLHCIYGRYHKENH